MTLLQEALKMLKICSEAADYNAEDDDSFAPIWFCPVCFEIGGYGSPLNHRSSCELHNLILEIEEYLKGEQI